MPLMAFCAADSQRYVRGQIMRKDIVLSIILLFFTSYVAAEPIPEAVFPKNNGTCVNDFAGLIKADDANKIKSLCKEIFNDELASIVICTINSIPRIRKEYENPVLFGSDLMHHLGIGRKGVNDGVLIFISKNDRKTAICTGYLTEYFLPDSEAGRVLNEYMIPNFKDGNFGQGIIDGIIEARKVMEKNRRLMYPEKYGKTNKP